MTDLYGAAFIAGPLAFVVVITLKQFRDAGRWARETDKLARNYDIALPADIATRVARHLRRQFMVGTALTFVVLLLLALSLPRFDDPAAPHRDATSYSLTLVTFPMLTIVYGLAYTNPAWNRAGARWVTHLVRRTPRQIFTGREWTAVTVGVAITVVSGCWGLWRVSAGGWWPAWPAAMTATVAMWWWAVRLILTRPSHAGDNIELAWDDMLRHREARDLTICAAWLPAGLIFFIDLDLAGSGNLLPIYAAIGVAFGLTRIFKDGRHLWRRSWNELGPA